MKGGVSADVNTALNEVFEVVLSSSLTRLRSKTRLSSLMMYEDEQDSRKRQKYETIVEDMKSVSSIEGKQWFL